MRWLGVDVGGPRKGFDVALIDDGAVRVLARLDLDGVIALAAAVTARAYSRGETEAFGAIVVPRPQAV
jgi:hypothetical protein